MGQQGIHSKGRDPVHCGTPAHDGLDIGGSGLKLEGQGRVGALPHGHGRYHFATALVGRQLLQPFCFAIKQADSGRGIHFMRGCRVKVHPKSLHVYPSMGHALGSVNQHTGPNRVGPVGQLLDGVHRSEGIGYMIECQQLRLRVDQALGLVEVEAAVGQNRNVAQGGSAVLGKHLPGNQVAVVLQLADQNLVAGA